MSNGIIFIPKFLRLVNLFKSY